MEDNSYWPLKESKPELPRCSSNIPILAYKRCSLGVLEDDVILGSFIMFTQDERPEQTLPWQFEPYEAYMKYRSLHFTSILRKHKDFESCQCGFYSVNTSNIKMLYGTADEYYGRSVDEDRIRASGYKEWTFPYLLVELSGVVIRCEFGYRSENMRLIKVCIDDKRFLQAAPDIENQIMKKYGIPVVSTIEELII